MQTGAGGKEAEDTQETECRGAESHDVEVDKGASLGQTRDVTGRDQVAMGAVGGGEAAAAVGTTSTDDAGDGSGCANVDGRADEGAAWGRWGRGDV